MRNNEYYARYLRVCLGWLESYYCRSGYFHVGIRVLNSYLTVLNTRGKPGAIKWSKDLRHALYCWLAVGGYSQVNQDSKSEVRLPSSLRFLRHVVKQEKDYPIIRLVLTALYASRDLKLPVELDVKSIVAPPTHEKAVLASMKIHVQCFWKALGFNLFGRKTVPKKVLWSKFHMSTKVNPSGRQSMWGSVAEVKSLPNSLLESIGTLGGSELLHKMEILRSVKSPNPLFSYFDRDSDAGSTFRKVTGIQSQEGKTRAVAILDYWSQTALRGLHQFLFRWLRRIPQDCTFDQGSFVHKLPDNGEPFYSVDLTAATDRFPIDLIESVLLGRFPTSYVAAWRDIMVGYPFKLPDGSFINYSTGNPMGAYSSWNSFALSHHFVMFYCCRVIGMDWSEAPYVLLGDDICIRHRLLAETYVGVLRSLGVEVSEKKTHISKSFREFAKRVLVDDVELTPFPIAALWSTRRHPDLSLGVCFNELSKGWVLNERIPDALADLYTRVGMPHRFVTGTRRLLNIAYDLLVGLQGRIDATSALKPSLEKYYPKIDISNVDFSKVLKSVVMSSFAKSASPREGESLENMAVELVCMLTDPYFEMFVDSPGHAKHPWTSIDLIYAIPVLQVRGLAEEEWLEIRKEVFDSLSQGDWKLTLRALTVPLSDRLYMGSNEDIKPKASFSLAKILERHIRLIEDGKAIDGHDPVLVQQLTEIFGLTKLSSTSTPTIDPPPSATI